MFTHVYVQATVFTLNATFQRERERERENMLLSRVHGGNICHHGRLTEAKQREGKFTQYKYIESQSTTKPHSHES